MLRVWVDAALQDPALARRVSAAARLGAPADVALPAAAGGSATSTWRPS